MQHHIGELLASSCKNHARVGGCKLSGVALNSSHVRVLQFEEGEKRSVLAYMLQQDDNGTSLLRLMTQHSTVLWQQLPLYIFWSRANGCCNSKDLCMAERPHL